MTGSRHLKSVVQTCTLKTADHETVNKRVFSVRYNAVITCKIKLFQNYFSLRRRPSEIILQEIISKLFHRLTAPH